MHGWMHGPVHMLTVYSTNLLCLHLILIIFWGIWVIDQQEMKLFILVDVCIKIRLPGFRITQGNSSFQHDQAIWEKGRKKGRMHLYSAKVVSDATCHPALAMAKGSWIDWAEGKPKTEEHHLSILVAVWVFQLGNLCKQTFRILMADTGEMLYGFLVEALS